MIHQLAGSVKYTFAAKRVLLVSILAPAAPFFGRQTGYRVGASSRRSGNFSKGDTGTPAGTPSKPMTHASSIDTWSPFTFSSASSFLFLAFLLYPWPKYAMTCSLN